MISCTMVSLICLHRWCVICLLLVCVLPCCLNTSEPTLSFVYAVYRHGPRSPLISIYPPEHYQDRVGKYFPEGPGQLTKKGKQLMYDIGKALKKRYEQFLNQDFHDSKFHFSSTDSTRTIMSAMLITAAIFPPKGHQVWKEDLQWQPIPVSTSTGHFDKHHVMHDRIACPRIYQELQERKNSLLKPDTSLENQEMYQFLLNKTGINMTAVAFVSGVYDFLECQIYVGAPLPDWAKQIHPEKTRPFSKKMYQVLIDDEKIFPVFAGPLLYEITSTLQAKAKGFLKPDRLMHFHASHDMVLRPLMVALGFNHTALVGPGDTILFELHFIDNSYKVKMFYFRPLESLDEFRQFPLNGIEGTCELDAFLKMVPAVTPKLWEANC